MVKGDQHLGAAALALMLVVAIGVTLIPVVGSSVDNSSADDRQGVSLASRRYQLQPDFANTTMLVFFNIKNGKVQRSFHTTADLLQKPKIVVDGYVAGIVALSDAELDVYVDHTRMRKVSRQKDGTLFFDHFGKLNPKEIFILDMADDPDSMINHYSKDAFLKGYSFFPKITGDAVSPDDRFVIDILKEGKRIEVAVHQNGYRDLLPDELLPSEACRFRYIGDRVHALDAKIQALEERIRAVTEGIAEIEEAFQVRLVRNVNIVDCEGIHNALTRAGYDDIWFFVDTFQNESVSELKTITKHEVLHLLVDRYNLTKSTGIREAFANLKGYDELSFERFFLVTQGKNKKQSKSAGKDHHFFAFINEKNFFPGSKGGHSQDNLDEFCTSFLHSLLVPGQLEENLNDPLSIGANRPAHNLSNGEKREVLAYYRKMIGFYIGLIGRDSSEHIGRFLQARLSHVEKLMNDFTWANNTVQIK